MSSSLSPLQSDLTSGRSTSPQYISGRRIDDANQQAARARCASTRVKFEHWSALGRFHRVVDVDLIDGANNPRADPRLSRNRGEDVTDKRGRLWRRQLDRRHLLSLASEADGG